MSTSSHSGSSYTNRLEILPLSQLHDLSRRPRRHLRLGDVPLAPAPAAVFPAAIQHDQPVAAYPGDDRQPRGTGSAQKDSTPSNPGSVASSSSGFAIPIAFARVGDELRAQLRSVHRALRDHFAELNDQRLRTAADAVRTTIDTASPTAVSATNGCPSCRIT